MQQEMNIRPASELDLGVILSIYNEIIANTTAVFHYDLQTMESRKSWFDQKRKEGYPVFVAESKGEILGFSSFGPFRNWQAYRFSVENSVYVRSDRRGMGIGKKLLKVTIDAAREMGMHTMIAGIEEKNQASIAMHKQFGFREAAILKEVGFKFERWLDLVFLQLLL
jgi:L-amino acid N-acyltransferase YncA